MSRCGDVYENTVTGEYAVVLRGTQDRGDGPMLAHLTARPGCAVIGEHLHPNITERFTVVRGRLEARIAGELRLLNPGDSVTVAAGVAHDWWNGSDREEAHVLIEIEAAAGADDSAIDRFELMIGTLFGLANDGKVDHNGRPSLLQGAVIAREFADVIAFTQPPPVFQRATLGPLNAIGRWLGYRAIDPRYCGPHGRTIPDPEMLAAAGLAPAATITQAHRMSA